MSEYLQRLRKLSKNKKNVHSNVSFVKAIDYIERLESELGMINVNGSKVPKANTDGPKTFKRGEVFSLNGFEWRVRVVTGLFIIATKSHISEDDEPEHADDIITVRIPCDEDTKL